MTNANVGAGGMRTRHLGAEMSESHSGLTEFVNWLALPP